MSVKDFIKFYDKDPLIKKNLLKRHSIIHYFYGAVYSLKNQLKLINDMNFYNISVKIHLVKILDIHDDPRQLIQKITNNKLDNIPDINDLKKDNKDSKQNDKGKSKTKLSDNLRGNFKDFSKYVSRKLMDKSNINPEAKKFFNKVLGSHFRSWSRSLDLSQIPEDQQSSDPYITDLSNKFSVNFSVSLNTEWTDSINFNDQARIVNTWNRILTPGSTWEFNLTHHFGKGLNLNYLYDIESVNSNHLVILCFVFVLESFGDKRGKIIRRKDEGASNGYSLVVLRCDFNHQITYLGKESDHVDDDITVVSKRKRKDTDFIESSLFNQSISIFRLIVNLIFMFHFQILIFSLDLKKISLNLIF